MSLFMPLSPHFSSVSTSFSSTWMDSVLSSMKVRQNLCAIFRSEQNVRASPTESSHNSSWFECNRRFLSSVAVSCLGEKVVTL